MLQDYFHEPAHVREPIIVQLGRWSIDMEPAICVELSGRENMQVLFSVKLHKGPRYQIAKVSQSVIHFCVCMVNLTRRSGCSL